MINFNEPIMVEKAFDYVREAINNKKLSGDGEFTKDVTSGWKNGVVHQKFY